MITPKAIDEWIQLIKKHPLKAIAYILVGIVIIYILSLINYEGPTEKLETKVESNNQSGGITANNVKITINNQNEPKIPLEENLYVKIHHKESGKRKIYIEIRPKQGKWYPFFVGFLHAEIGTVDPNPDIDYAPAGKIPGWSMTSTKNTRKDEWQIFIGNHPATPSNSYYVACKELPSKIIFGETDPSNKKYLYTFYKNK